MSRTAPYCPDCGQLDLVRKVSAIYDSETRIVTNAFGVSVVSSSLADRFAPPEQPEPACEPISRSLAWLSPFRRQGWRLRFRSHCSGCLVLIVLLALSTSPTLRAGVLSLTPMLIVLLVAGGVLWAWLRHHAQQRYQSQLALWEAEVGAWRERYYCGRCDETFVPQLPSASTSYTGQTIRLVP